MTAEKTTLKTRRGLAESSAEITGRATPQVYLRGRTTAMGRVA